MLAVFDLHFWLAFLPFSSFYLLSFFTYFEQTMLQTLTVERSFIAAPVVIFIGLDWLALNVASKSLASPN